MYGNERDVKGSFLGTNEDLNTGDGGESSPLRDHSKPKGTVSINNIDPGNDPTETENVLEYVLTTISQGMGLNPKQAAGLLSNNNKYLVHVCVKGVKGDFEKISQWYQNVYRT